LQQAQDSDSSEAAKAISGTSGRATTAIVDKKSSESIRRRPIV
jgi:hypothetical protein